MDCRIVTDEERIIQFELQVRHLEDRQRRLEGQLEAQRGMLKMLRSKLFEANLDNQNMSKMAIVLQQIGFRQARVGETPVTYMTRLGIEIADAKMENPGYPGPIHPSVNSWMNAYYLLTQTFPELPDEPDPVALHRRLCDFVNVVRDAMVKASYLENRRDMKRESDDG